MSHVVGSQALVAARRIQHSLEMPSVDRAPARFRWSDFFDEIDQTGPAIEAEQPALAYEPDIAETRRDGVPQLTWIAGLAGIGLFTLGVLGVWATWLPSVTDDWAHGSTLVGRETAVRSFAAATELRAPSIEEPSRLVLFSAAEVPPRDVEVAGLDEPLVLSDVDRLAPTPAPAHSSVAPIEADVAEPDVEPSPVARPAPSERRKKAKSRPRTAPQTPRVAAAPEAKPVVSASPQPTDASNPLVALLFPLAPLFTPPQPGGAALAP